MVEPDRDTKNAASRAREMFHHAVTAKEDRKLLARKQGDRGPWFWLGMFGLVGWSVAVPTFLGIALGIWLDRRFDGRTSWTLTMLFLGTAMGCWTAWYWIQRESQRR